MSFGDYLYVIAIVLFSFMTFTIVKNNFLSKFDDQERRKDLIDEYEDDYISDKQNDESKSEPKSESEKD